MARANIDCGFYPSKQRCRDRFPTAVGVEPARPRDIEELLPLMRAFYAGEKLAFDAGVLRRALDELWSEPLHSGAWIARAGGEPVGYGVLCCGFSFEYSGRDAFVDELFVRPTWRDRGIGALLLAHPDGRRLYLRRGFVNHERHLMTKQLDR